jgi:hypothetical protein
MAEGEDREMTEVYTYGHIAAKAEWEGGWDEALDWFKPEEVPTEIRHLWYTAKAHKRRLTDLLDQISTFFPEELL